MCREHTGAIISRMTMSLMTTNMIFNVIFYTNNSDENNVSE